MRAMRFLVYCIDNKIHVVYSTLYTSGIGTFLSLLVRAHTS